MPKTKNLAHCLSRRITWSLTSREDVVLRVIENNVLRRDWGMRNMKRGCNSGMENIIIIRSYVFASSEQYCKGERKNMRGTDEVHGQA